MRKTFLQKLAIAFSIAFAFIYSVIFACGGYDWYDNYEDSTNFTPEAFVDEKSTPYLLSQNLFYSGELGEGTTRFDDDNFGDWSGYLNGKLNNEYLSYFLRDSAKTDVEEIYSHAFKKKQAKTAKKWGGKIDLNDKKVMGFIEFLHYAKPIETYSTTENSGWSYDEVAPLKMNDAARIKALEKKYETTSDEFLKNRYWFQVMKAYFYSNDAAPSVAFFEKTAEKQPKNTLYYRAVGYLAGVNSGLGKVAKANYLYSQVFDKCPKLQNVAMFCFNPNEEKDWNEAFNYAKNDEEKVALWAIQGYYADEEKAIENIFSLNPKSAYLEFLLARLINNEELKINSSFENQTVIQYKAAVKDSVRGSAVTLIDKIAQSGKVDKPYYWNCAAGYLQTLDGNFEKADRYFKAAEKDLPKTELAAKQLRLFRFVNNLSKIDKVSDKNFSTVIADLNWLYFEIKEEDEVFRHMNAESWSRKYISALYRAKKDNVMAEIFNHHDEFYSTDANVLSMKKLLLKKDKSPIEQIGAKAYQFNAENISEYQAFVSVFQNKIPEAVVFIKESGQQDVVFDANPFNGNIKDCHDCDYAAKQKRKYSHLQLLNTMQLLKDKIEKQEDVYINAMLLANAFYNLTHYGNARMFYEGNVIGYGSTELYFEPKMKALITDCSLAKMYYEKALSAAKNNEQKAKMYYMISKCERNDYYNGKYVVAQSRWDVKDGDVDFIAWNGFKELKSNYSNTKFYQEAIAECGYFNTYISQDRK
jgi:hypothetical protein